MKNVYYHVTDAGGADVVVTTAKDYWDENHFVDDGSGPDYGVIEAAMEACGARRLAESVYGMPPAGVRVLRLSMSRRGFAMVTDEAFSSFLASRA